MLYGSNKQFSFAANILRNLVFNTFFLLVNCQLANGKVWRGGVKREEELRKKSWNALVFDVFGIVINSVAFSSISKSSFSIIYVVFSDGMIMTMMMMVLMTHLMRMMHKCIMHHCIHLPPHPYISDQLYLFMTYKLFFLIKFIVFFKLWKSFSPTIRTNFNSRYQFIPFIWWRINGNFAVFLV